MDRCFDGLSEKMTEKENEQDSQGQQKSKNFGCPFFIEIDATQAEKEDVNRIRELADFSISSYFPLSSRCPVGWGLLQQRQRDNRRNLS